MIVSHELGIARTESIVTLVGDREMTSQKSSFRLGEVRRGSISSRIQKLIEISQKLLDEYIA